MGNDRRTVELRKFLNVHWGEGIGFLRKLWYEASGIGKKEFKIKGFLD